MVIRKKLKGADSALFFVTTTVLKWIPIFNNRAAAKIAIFQLDETAKYHGVSIVGYVLMPDS